jgi:glycosyltransferase involved in cell wall biosynthesis
MRVIACNSPYGQGGVGQHFAQLVEESRAQGMLAQYYAPVLKSGSDVKGRKLKGRWWQEWVVKYTPVRFSPGWRSALNNAFFDWQLAATLETPAERLMGFVGKSLHSFQRARDLGFDHLELVAANSHVHNVKRLHNWAREQHGISDSWLNGAQIRKTLREYEAADTIYVHSDYTRQSFVEAGIPSEKLERTYLRVHPRFQPPEQRPDDGTFRIVYVGRVEATKGIPLLLEAFSGLSIPNKTLTLVGGWSTRRMRKYMEEWLKDDRVRMAPGDPVPHLHEADVFVHPTYEDGFGYAPMEALACGVPVIATEDTGMKEYVQEGKNGYVVPTGRVEPIRERLEHLYEEPKSTVTSLLPGAYAMEQAAVPVGSSAALDHEHG